MKIAALVFYILSLAVLAFVYFNDFIRYNYLDISRHALGIILLSVLVIGGIIMLLLFTKENKP